MFIIWSIEVHPSAIRLSVGRGHFSVGRMGEAPALLWYSRSRMDSYTGRKWMGVNIIAHNNNLLLGFDALVESGCHGHLVHFPTGTVFSILGAYLV